MTCRIGNALWAAGVALASILFVGEAISAQPPQDSQESGELAAARKYVEASSKYLHHGRLRRGMKGYALTVLAGTEVVKFQAEILSVMNHWGPRQDVILARLSGQNLESTGLIAGMSGSPVYVRDEDGKDKMIGAIAYGWRAAKEPMCGIQPITYMLAIAGVLDKLRGEGGGAPKAAASLPATQGGAGAKAAPPPPGAAASLHAAPPDFLKTFLDPRKIDFSRLDLGRRAALPAGLSGGTPQLVPLATPLMVSGLEPRTLAEMLRELEPAGIIPVQAGSVSAALAAARKNTRLEPGSAVSVPLVTGDADLTAVGTITEVIGDNVLAFGHGMFGEGEAALPMGPAYVHGVIAGLVSSVKLGSTLGVTGSLCRDEKVGVRGLVGAKTPTIPLTLSVDWAAQRRTYHYNVCRHRMLTAMLARIVIMDAVPAWKELPQFHTVRHSVDIDFGKLGKYHAANVTSGDDIMAAASDATRPIAALMNNPFDDAPAIERIDVNLTVESGATMAQILDFKLDGNVYRPGETLSGVVTVRPFRSPRKTLPVRFELPADLAEGTYTLTVCNSQTAIASLQLEMPQRFDPRTLGELFQAIQRVVEGDNRQLYARLPLNRGGLSINKGELSDLPESRAYILAEADCVDTNSFARSLVRSVATEYVLDGSDSVEFRVQREPKETLLREQRKH